MTVPCKYEPLFKLVRHLEELNEFIVLLPIYACKATLMHVQNPSYNQSNLHMPNMCKC